MLCFLSVPTKASISTEEAPATSLMTGEDKQEGIEANFDVDEDAILIKAGIEKSLKRKGLRPVDIEKGRAKKQRKQSIAN